MGEEWRDAYFSLDGMIDMGDAKEINASRVAFIDQMAGQRVRLWFGDDYPGSMPHAWQLKGTVIMPARPWLVSRHHVTLWLAQQGLLIPQRAGSEPIPRVLM